MPLINKNLKEFINKIWRLAARTEHQSQGIENGKLVWADKDFAMPIGSIFLFRDGSNKRNDSKNGIFWFRKELIFRQAGVVEITINMGPIDDDDFTYFNGDLIGQTEGWMSPRNYKIPEN